MLHWLGRSAEDDVRKNCCLSVLGCWKGSGVEAKQSQVE